MAAVKKRDGVGLSTQRAFEIQHATRDFLLASGIARHINEVADEGPAPMSYLPNGQRLVQCDLELVLTDSRRRCLGDVKAKSEAAWWRSRNYHATGISSRHLDAYRRQSSEMGDDALVFFVHVAEGEVRYCSVWSTLWDQGDGDGGDMMFVAYYQLPLLATWDGQHTFALKAEPFLRLSAGVQLELDGLELPMRRPPAGVKGWLQP